MEYYELVVLSLLAYFVTSFLWLQGGVAGIMVRFARCCKNNSSSLAGQGEACR